MYRRLVANGLLLSGLTLLAEAQAAHGIDATASTTSVAAKASDQKVIFRALDQDALMAMIPAGPCGTVHRMSPRQFAYNAGREGDRTIVFYPSWSQAISAAREHCLALSSQIEAKRQAAQEIAAWQKMRADEAAARQRNTSYPPVPLSMPDPDMPEEGRSLRIEGTVVVHLVISITGQPEQLSVVKTNLHSPLLKTVPPPLIERFESSALEAVSKYRFKPSFKSGNAAASEMNVEVGFQIY